jgi:hypothetical protein
MRIRYEVGSALRSTLLLFATTLASISCSSADPGSDGDTAASVPTPAVPAPAQPRLACWISSDPVIAGEGIGDLRVGASVDEVRRLCRVISDTTIASDSEGMQQRWLLVQVAGDTVRAAVNENHVSRIESNSASVKTADSLGTGTAAAVLRERSGKLLVGDRGVFATLPTHCGLSFQLANVPVSAGKSWRSVPDSARVGTVLAIGCPDSTALK